MVNSPSLQRPVKRSDTNLGSNTSGEMPTQTQTPEPATATFLKELPKDAQPIQPSITPLLRQLELNGILQVTYTQGNKTAATRVANNNKWIIRCYRTGPHKENLCIQRLK